MKLLESTVRVVLLCLELRSAAAAAARKAAATQRRTEEEDLSSALGPTTTGTNVFPQNHIAL